MSRKRTIAAVTAAAALAVGGLVLPTAQASPVIGVGSTTYEGQVFQPGELVGARLKIYNRGTSPYTVKNLKVIGCNKYTKMTAADEDGHKPTSAKPTPEVLEPGETIFIYCGFTRDTPGYAGVNIIMGDSPSFHTQEVAVAEFAGPKYTGPTDPASDWTLQPSLNIGIPYKDIDGGLQPSVETTHEVGNIVRKDDYVNFVLRVDSDVYSDLAILNPTVEGCEAIDPQPVMMPGDSRMFQCSVPIVEFDQLGNEKGHGRKAEYSLTFAGDTVNGPRYSTKFEGGLWAEFSPNQPEPPQPTNPSEPSEPDSPEPGEPEPSEPAPDPSEPGSPEPSEPSEPTDPTDPSEPDQSGPLKSLVSGPATLRVGESGRITIAVTNTTKSDINNVSVKLPGCQLEQVIGKGTSIPAGETFTWACDFTSKTAGTFELTPEVSATGVKFEVTPVSVEVRGADDTTEPEQPDKPSPSPSDTVTPKPTDKPSEPSPVGDDNEPTDAPSMPGEQGVDGNGSDTPNPGLPESGV